MTMGRAAANSVAKFDPSVHWNARVLAVVLVLAAAAASAFHPDLFGRTLINSDGGKAFLRFFEAAKSPSLSAGTDASISLVPMIKEAIVATIAVAFAAMGLAIFLGSIIGCFASESIWDTQPADGVDLSRSPIGRVFLRGMIIATRVFLALARSVHELIWALLLACVFRVHLFFGILALAIPFAASYARIFAETLDEAPREAARALRCLGAGRASTFVFGLLPRALKNMLSYTFYRFDCAVRSSAILGFVGFQTIGLYIRNSFNELYYEETWTWLYVLFVILIVTETASGLVRRRLAS